MIKFAHEPSFAELWDACLYNFLYDAPKYIKEVETLLIKLKIAKKSNLIDLSAGTGFMSMELAERGYNFEYMDAMDDEIKEFSRKARERNLPVKSRKLNWLEIPNTYPREHFDMAFCRGNSFIYAAGGWNGQPQMGRSNRLELYVKTAKVFYDSLKNGGYLYVDKFRDDEIPGKNLVGNVLVAGKPHDLLFYTEIKRAEGHRSASMLLRDEQGHERGLPNMTYILTLQELTGILKEVGFSDVRKIKLESETHFDVLLAKK